MVLLKLTWSGDKSNDCLRVSAAGAGQDVGRSCIMVGMGGRNIMFDCGMHLGFRDERRCGAAITGLWLLGS